MRGLGLGNITILTYHSVNPTPADKYSVSPAALARQLSFVRDHYPIVALRDIRKHFGRGGRKVIVTFDDGFADFVAFAHPILVRLGIPVTLFVPTGYLGGWNLWDAGNTDVGRKRLMTAADLRAVCADRLVDAGSHTMDHLSMKDLSVPEMYVQARGARQFLEALLGTPVTMFSYPYGHWTNFSSTTERVLAESGYEIAVTGCWGTRNSAKNLLCLRRIATVESDTALSLRAKIEGFYNWIGVKRHAAYAARTTLRTAAGLFRVSRSAVHAGGAR